MDAGKIYLRDGDSLVPLAASRYDAEDVLQSLLASYPDLLAGEQMRPSEPRRWLLIAREASVPDSEGGQSRWSLDHLFIDQDAIPTLVEVKRSSDTRIRREVVGQMLDYAANVVAYWQGGQLRELYELEAARAGSDADQAVLTLLGETFPSEEDAGRAIDGFWQRAVSNLVSRTIRMVFVADVIPQELERIIEFLNESLVRAEVFGVEVRQYVGQGRQMLVPRVLGRTATAEDVKKVPGASQRVARSWTEAEFLDAAAITGPELLRFVQSALDWIRRKGFPVTFGRGKYGPLYFNAVGRGGGLVRIANVSSQGQVMVQYDSLVKAPPFDEVANRLELNEMLNRIPGVHIAERLAVDASWPGVPLAALTPPASERQFFEILDWAVKQVSESA